MLHVYSKRALSFELATSHDSLVTLPAYCNDAHMMSCVTEAEPEDCPHYFGPLIHAMLAIL